jgi:hypothetical protein
VTVGKVDHRHVERCKPLAVHEGAAGHGMLDRSWHLCSGPGGVVAFDERGVGSQHHDRPGPGPHGELDRVGRGRDTQLFQDRIAWQVAHRDHTAVVAGAPPGIGGLHEEIQGRHHHQEPPVRQEFEETDGGGEGFAGAGRRHQRPGQPFRGNLAQHGMAIVGVDVSLLGHLVREKLHSHSASSPQVTGRRAGQRRTSLTEDPHHFTRMNAERARKVR